jgi:cyclopropane-fatty-acyl-phospholipid synthase
MSVSQQRSTGYRGASLAATQRHYDLSDDFFRIWLGPSLAYSSARWAAGDTLETAQARKVEYLIEQAGIQPGHRVLDIGCGYGYELTRLIEDCRIGAAVGITLSEAAVRWLRQRSLPQLEVRLENWIDHRPAEPYDAIMSFEAFEHFARPGMPGPRKVSGYRRFFQRCRSAIKPHGRLVIQTISWGHRFPLERQLLADLYLASRTYPECNPSFLSEIVAASDGLFDIVAMRNDFDDYSRTARAWVANLDADWDHAVELVGERKASDFRRCMSTAVRAFGNGWFYLHRLTFRPVARPTGRARRFLVNNVLGLGPGPAGRDRPVSGRRGRPPG